MILLDDLEPYFDALFEHELDKINSIYQIFLDDFLSNSFFINNKKVIIKNHYSTLKGYEKYFETFVHIVTWKSSKAGKRVFDFRRANRVHWIRSILEQRNDPRIKYFQYAEGDGALRDYYWFDEKDYIVIVEQITVEYLLVTGFVIDNRNRIQKRYEKYLDGLK
ncbi:MAG: hypothetical protein FD143_1306 [Ignavibacteria bacterium]|nr:MAG: hypothetical protein FD143_1306 [Ignavibacteria bacterium]KAF0160825.1 MAG: hypothetical protein FD188_1430 [Ignavibacteria bacterium]